MAKYSPEYKLQVIKRILEDGVSTAEVVKKYNVRKSEVRKWVAAYKTHGMDGIVRKHNSYSGKFKQEVIEDMRTNKLSFFETAVKYNLGNHDLVARWERIYLEEGPEGLYIERRGKVSSRIGTLKGRPPKLDKKIEDDLIAENQRLRMENDYLKKLNALVREREISERKKKPR